MATTKTAQIQKSIDRTRADLAAFAADIDEISEAFHAGKADAGDLDNAIQVKAQAEARLAEFERQLAAEGAKDQQAEQRAVLGEQARHGQRALALLDEIQRAEADVENYFNAFVSAALRREELAHQFGSETYDAGLRDRARLELTDWRAVSAFMADRLTRSGVAPKLDYIAVGGVQHLATGTTLADLSQIRAEKLRALVGRRLAELKEAAK